MPATADALSPELRGYRDDFAAHRRAAAALAADVPTEWFNAPPVPDAWSAAQCLDHLNEAGTLLVPRLETAIDAARSEGRFAEGPFRYGLFSRWFIKLMGPDARWKLSSPKRYTPKDVALAPDDVVATFQALQDRLVALTERAQGLDLKAIRVTSPAARWLRLPLGAWLAATAAHQARHLQQAQKALDAIYPASS